MGPSRVFRSKHCMGVFYMDASRVASELLKFWLGATAAVLIEPCCAVQGTCPPADLDGHSQGPNARWRFLSEGLHTLGQPGFSWSGWRLARVSSRGCLSAAQDFQRSPRCTGGRVRVDGTACLGNDASSANARRQEVACRGVRPAGGQVASCSAPRPDGPGAGEAVACAWRLNPRATGCNTESTQALPIGDAP